MFKEKKIKYTRVLQNYSSKVYKTQSYFTHLRWSKAFEFLKNIFSNLSFLESWKEYQTTFI